MSRKLKDKIKDTAVLVAHSIAYAMHAGDKEIVQAAGGNGDSEINHHVTDGSIMNDLLNENETQQVKELRDVYYRVTAEAEKIKALVEFDDNGDLVVQTDSEGNIVGGGKHTLQKRTKDDYSQHVTVDESDGLPLKLIQFNYKIEKKSVFGVTLEELVTTKFNPFDYYTTVDINFEDGITPRYQMNKFLTKIVVKELNEDEDIIDLYFPEFPGQFTKLDALFISELSRQFNEPMYRSELRYIDSIEFNTDKAWSAFGKYNATDAKFKWDKMEYKSITKFDGSYLVKFVGNKVIDGVYVGDKFKTEEVDKKYGQNAVKDEQAANTIDFGMALYKMNKDENKDKQNENCN